MRTYRINIGDHYLEMGIEVPDFAFTGKHGSLLDKTIEGVLNPILISLLRIISDWVVLIISEHNIDDRRIFRLSSCIEDANVLDDSTTSDNHP